MKLFTFDYCAYILQVSGLMNKLGECSTADAAGTGQIIVPTTSRNFTTLALSILPM